MSKCGSWLWRLRTEGASKVPKTWAQSQCQVIKCEDVANGYFCYYCGRMFRFVTRRFSWR